MVAVRLTVYVGEDRQLAVKLPDEVPVGRVDVIIEVPSRSAGAESNPERERLRAKLLAAGAILSHVEAPPGARRLSVEERLRLGTMPPGTRPSEALIDEDRGRW